LGQEREFDCVRRIRENDKKRIARGFDLLMTEPAEDFPDRGMVAPDRRDRFLVFYLLVKNARVDNFKEHQSQDRYLVAALKLLNFSSAPDRDLL
jgi:hypothetical protein